MKVISGKYRGRILEGASIEGTRPTMDRIKESLFAMIQEDVSGSVVLDLFAGSGSLGIEALSNGARQVFFCDHNWQAIAAIRRNIRSLALDQCTVLFQGDYKRALALWKAQKFSLVFLDPPYKEEFIPDIMCYMEQNHMLSPQAILVCEVGTADFVFTNDYFSLYKERHYTDKHIYIYRYKGECVAF